jgi:CTP:molybdopterin cytidylyltransferase MocA
MGGPKALLLVEGRTLLERHVERLLEAGCAPVLAVVRPGLPLPDALRGVGRVHLAEVVTASPAESLAAGVEALCALLPGGRSALARVRLLVGPVDLVPPRVETLRALLSALEGEVLAATPAHQGRGGHPVALRGTLLAGVGEGAAPTLREVLAAAGARRVRLAVEDAAVLGDLDTPEAAAAVLGAGPPRFLGL